MLSDKSFAGLHDLHDVMGSDVHDQQQQQHVMWDVLLDKVTRATTRTMTAIVDEFRAKRQPMDVSNVAELLRDIEDKICNVEVATNDPDVRYTIGEIVTARILSQKTHRRDAKTEMLQAEGEEDTIPVRAELVGKRRYRRRRNNAAPSTASSSIVHDDSEENDSEEEEDEQHDDDVDVDV